tara:strand:+ start:67 stop:321 length:255 start_codon:yes stop_codon:yes gene_type:complete
MGKNKEEFMKDREQEAQYVIHNHNLIDTRIVGLEGELEEVKHLLSQCKTLIADMVMYNLDKDMYSRYDDIMKQAQELLTELKEY